MRFSALWVVGSIVFCSQCGLGQSAQATTAALFRTLMIETNVGRATTFALDVDNRQYWITAKHVFSGVKTGPAGSFTAKHVFANLLSLTGDGEDGHDQHWMTEQFTVIDPGKDIDILVLVPDHLVFDFPAGYTLKWGGTVGFGGDCEFLGFPYGGGWKSEWKDPKQPDKESWYWLPYVKHCTPSALLREKGLSIWVLDGFNNEGFSGGPVLTQTGTNQEVFAVISGFYTEPLEVLPVSAPGERRTNSIPPAPKLPGKNQPKTEIVRANSGFIVAYDIQPAIDAIRANPIGPLKPEAAPK